MITQTIKALTASALSKNGLVGGQNTTEMSDGNLLVMLITSLVVLAILLTAGKYIWNEVLIQVIPGIKPLENVTQLLLLWLLLNLLFCR